MKIKIKKEEKTSLTTKNTAPKSKEKEQPEKKIAKPSEKGKSKKSPSYQRDRARGVEQRY